jgi:hypothetical protein
VTKPIDLLRSNADQYRTLFFDWFRKLAQDAELPFSQHGSSGDAFSLGGPGEFQVTAKFVDAQPFLRFESNDSGRKTVVEELARQAAARVDAGDLGGIVWYSTTIAAPTLQMSPRFGLSAVLEHLHNRLRIVGWLRLGGSILLEFTEELPADWKEDAAALPPKAVIHVHVAVSAPCEGTFASRIAYSAVEIAGAICTFALMRAVDLPPLVVPSKPDVLSDLRARVADTGLRTLARKGIGLDITGAANVPGGLEYFARLRAAFLTFDAAMHQRHDLVACVLFVVVAECLVVPVVDWKELQVTKRFIDFYDELMPSTLDELVAHGNLESLFAIRRGPKKKPRTLRRELLSQIYAFRSGYVHQGLTPSYRSFMGSGAEDVRRGFFSEFAEGAILEYLKSPRCSFVGHPAYAKSDTAAGGEYFDGDGI